MKMGEGVTHEFISDDNKSYIKDIPSGAKLASIKKLGGRTIIWNQLNNYMNGYKVFYTYTEKGVTFSTNGDGRWSVSGTATGGNAYAYINTTTMDNMKFIKRHTYYVKGCPAAGNTSSTFRLGFCRSGSSVASDTGLGCLYRATVDDHDKPFRCVIYVYEGYKINHTFFPQIFDLTQMFGYGNEPTLEEIRQILPKTYYPYSKPTVWFNKPNSFSFFNMNNADLLLFEKLVNNKSLVNYTDGLLNVNSTVYSIYTQGIQCHAKKGDVFAFEYKVGTATNIRPRYKTSAGYLHDFPTLANNTEWTETSYTLLYDIVRLYFNWSSNGSFYIRNLRINGQEFIKTKYDIPEEILNLDGYGWGVSDTICNYIDFETKTYHKQVGRVDLGTLTYMMKAAAETLEGCNLFISDFLVTKNINHSMLVSNRYDLLADASDSTIFNRCYYGNPANFVFVDDSYDNIDDFKNSMKGIHLYYTLTNEEITDISDIIPEGFLESLEVEPNGYIIINNDHETANEYNIPLPNTVEFLSELSST